MSVNSHLDFTIRNKSVRGYLSAADVNAAATGVINIDLQNGLVSVVELTLTGNVTLNVINVPTGPHQVGIRLKQDATGTRTVTWGTGVKLPKAGAPTLTTTANEWEWIVLVKGSATDYDLMKSAGPYV